MFKNCSGAELTFLDSLMCETDVAAGRVLVREDQLAEQMLIVIDGRARVSRQGETLGLAERGALVCGRALRDRCTDAVTMTAETRMKLRTAGPREMRSILDVVPGLEAALWGAASEHVGIADEAEAYLRAWTQEPERVFAALMFTDIVRSSGTLSAQGVHAWHKLRDTFHEIVARQVARYNGIIVSAFGDGALARFSCAYSAARCTIGIRDELADLGLEVHVRPHARELALRGPDTSGVAVNIDNRICGTAR